MKRYSARCLRCTQTNLVWYHPEDPELKRRVAELTGVREPGSTVVSLLMVALIAAAVSGGVYAYQTYIDKTGSSVAVNPSALTH